MMVNGMKIDLMVVEKLIIKMVIPMTVNDNRDMEKVHLHILMEINT